MLSNRLFVPVLILVSLAFCALVVYLLVWQDPDPKRYSAQIARFNESDLLQPKAPGSVVFVGSSSIRGWDVAKRFPDLPIVNRGFGGSEISDINYYVEEVVLKYKPSVVVFYAGENDIAGRKDPRRVLEDYRQFVERVTKDNPETDIIYISIKPSLGRRKVWPQMKEANEYIELFSACYRNYHFVDVAASMLNHSSEAQAAFYVEDGIHMTSKGYEIWTNLLAPVLLNAYRTEKTGE